MQQQQHEVLCIGKSCEPLLKSWITKAVFEQKVRRIFVCVKDDDTFSKALYNIFREKVIIQFSTPELLQFEIDNEKYWIRFIYWIFGSSRARGHIADYFFCVYDENDATHPKLLQVLNDVFRPITLLRNSNFVFYCEVSTATSEEILSGDDAIKKLSEK